MNTSEQLITTIEKDLSALKEIIANLNTFVSNQVVTKHDLDRIRTEIVLMKDQGYEPEIVGNINTADLRTMLEIKPTLDNLLVIINSFDVWKTTMDNILSQLGKQIGQMQIQLTHLAREHE